MIVLVDNQDSFTFNIYRYCQELSLTVEVIDSEKQSLEAIKNLNPTHLIISPGPGNPSDAKLSLQAINYYKEKIPILGICLGHQCLAFIYGAKIKQAKQIYHGKTSHVTHHQRKLFSGLPNPLKVCRYHSLAVDSSTLSQDFEISALTSSQEIMAINHRSLPLFGLQFHPEALLSECGHQLLSNFQKIS